MQFTVKQAGLSRTLVDTTTALHQNPSSQSWAPALCQHRAQLPPTQLLQSSQQHWEVGTTDTPILQMRRLRLGGLTNLPKNKLLACSTAGKQT